MTEAIDSPEELARITQRRRRAAIVMAIAMALLFPALVYVAYRFSDGRPLFLIGIILGLVLTARLARNAFNRKK
jgi:hypothetical protein